MPDDIIQIARRIKELREILDIPVDELAGLCDVTPEKYLYLESGKDDFSFTFLYKLAKRFGVDITDLLTGESTRLSLYDVVRRGEGLPIQRREGFSYQNMAFLFKNRIAEPFVVTAPPVKNWESAEVALSTHRGQEFDMIFEGSLKVVIEGHTEILNPGDTIYYDSSHRHGMIAVGDKPCKFLAVVIGNLS
ncbi:hypothetical protein SDC9_111561 [bioreactor metagenome]|uniref:HTH cro/C1-type domain-containing protein n=1 Tax=bioreactor metagenome TaxID=1076179 RepID=A0A645BN15_9ZZZZ|nr:cupin domain-containing protein [Oscillospiraceae bacterium]